MFSPFVPLTRWQHSLSLHSPDRARTWRRTSERTDWCSHICPGRYWRMIMKSMHKGATLTASHFVLLKLNQDLIKKHPHQRKKTNLLTTHSFFFLLLRKSWSFKRRDVWNKSAASRYSMRCTGFGSCFSPSSKFWTRIRDKQRTFLKKPRQQAGKCWGLCQSTWENPLPLVRICRERENMASFTRGTRVQRASTSTRPFHCRTTLNTWKHQPPYTFYL